VLRLLRVWAGVAGFGLPLLALMLTPPLMRSRAGSESLLGVGVLLLFILLVGLVVVAPVAAGAAAAQPPAWTAGTALSSTWRVWSRHRSHAWHALGGFLAVYLAGQIVGYGYAELVPSVIANGPGPGWTILVGPYVAQSLILYAATTLAAAMYALRLRRAPLGAPAVPSAGG